MLPRVRCSEELPIGPNVMLEWKGKAASARVIPVPAAPIKAFRGAGKKGLVKKLLRDRQKEGASAK